jgi:hypothetical protein
MDIVAVFVEAFSLTLASALTALSLCALLYWIFRPTGHPSWGPPLALLLIPVAIALPGAWFVDTTALFVGIIAIPFSLIARTSGPADLRDAGH